MLSGVAFGARYAIVLSGPFMIEGEASFFPTSPAVLDTLVVDSAGTISPIVSISSSTTSAP
mgnify:CR=1 FL=1